MQGRIFVRHFVRDRTTELDELRSDVFGGAERTAGARSGNSATRKEAAAYGFDGLAQAGFAEMVTADC